MFSKVVGVTFDGRQNHLANLRPNEKLYLLPEPDNKYDKNAIGVVNEDGISLGYINRGLAYSLKGKIVNKQEIQEYQLIGGDGYNYGLMILI